MSRGPNRRRFREGICPEFGRVRPVHLGDFSSVETRQLVSAGAVLLSTRMGWAIGAPVPRIAEYLSVHQPWGKFLAVVERVSQSCVCCADRAMRFVFVSSVREAWTQDVVCECAAGREWRDSSHWAEPPGHGLCRRDGLGALSTLHDISDAIKKKSRK